MTAGLMRRISPSRFRAQLVKPFRSITTPLSRAPKRGLSNIRDRENALRALWFKNTTPSSIPSSPNGQDTTPPDERMLKLGKTIRILHDRLPTLLASPLPQETLSPQITLHLFPSTHPHLPTVSGKIAYTAALWTAPVAWGRVPVVGNVKLIILSERMVKNDGCSVPGSYGNEKLIVRWKTCGKTKGRGMGAFYRRIGAGGQVDKITEFLGSDVIDDEEFTGLFIFEFDEEGRIVSHTIEHVEEGNNWDKMPRVISVTDWLLGKAWGKPEGGGGLALGYCKNELYEKRHPRGDRRSS